MQSVTVSLSNSNLKVSTTEEGKLKVASAKVAEEKELVVVIRDLISKITVKPTKKLELNFLAEPKDTIAKFIIVDKSVGEHEPQIITEIRSKLEDTELEDLYFSYQKIAPFVYQFIGIKKELLEKYLNIANTLGISLKGIFPWTLFLPKLVKINEPAIFILRQDGKQVVALSEFNGIFYSGVYDSDKTVDELQTLVEELSVYKRVEPIKQIFTFNYDAFSLNSDYKVEEIKFPKTELETANDYEFHLMVSYILDNDNTIYKTQLNLLNLLPVPIVSEKIPSYLVTVGVAVGTLFIVGGLFVGITYLGNKNNTSDIGIEPVVLSESTETPETSEELSIVELQRKDLSIVVHNGAGIPGIAGKTKDFLEQLGYIVSDIGNAEKQNSKNTTLQFKSSKVSYKDLLSEDLKDNYDVVVTENLDEDADYDALIIVGSDADL